MREGGLFEEKLASGLSHPRKNDRAIPEESPALNAVSPLDSHARVSWLQLLSAFQPTPVTSLPEKDVRTETTIQLQCRFRNKVSPSFCLDTGYFFLGHSSRIHEKLRERFSIFIPVFPLLTSV